MQTYLGLDLGGTKLLIGEVTRAGEMLRSKQYPTGYNPPARCSGGAAGDSEPRNAIKNKPVSAKKADTGLFWAYERFAEGCRFFKFTSISNILSHGNVRLKSYAAFGRYFCRQTSKRSFTMGWTRACCPRRWRKSMSGRREGSRAVTPRRTQAI